MARGWTARQKGPANQLITGAARLTGTIPATIDGAVVITVDTNGVPTIAHNLQSRTDLPTMLRTVADGLEQQNLRQGRG